MKENNHIRRLLILSIIAGSIYGMGALLFGLLMQYNVLLLDGAYTLIGAVMSFISLYLAKYIQMHDFERFPFGKEPLMPLMVFVQYSIILLISVYGVIESVYTLVHIIPSSQGNSGLYFSIIGSVYCLLFYLYLKKNQLTHPFYWVEYAQWRFGFFFSAGVVLSFLLSGLLESSGYRHLAMYIDPIVSIGITLFFIQLALKELKHAILELTTSSVKSRLREEILTVVQTRLAREDVETYVLRTAKVGNQVIVELDLVITTLSSLDTVARQDPLREELHDAINQIIASHTLWLNINFVGDIKWAYSSVEKEI